MKNELYFLHFLRNLHSGLICATYSLWIMSKASSLSCHWGSEMFTVCTLEILAAQIPRIFLIHDNKLCPKFLLHMNRKRLIWRILELCWPAVMLFEERLVQTLHAHDLFHVMWQRLFSALNILQDLLGNWRYQLMEGQISSLWSLQTEYTLYNGGAYSPTVFIL